MSTRKKRTSTAEITDNETADEKPKRRSTARKKATSSTNTGVKETRKKTAKKKAASRKKAVAKKATAKSKSKKKSVSKKNSASKPMTGSGSDFAVEASTPAELHTESEKKVETCDRHTDAMDSSIQFDNTVTSIHHIEPSIDGEDDPESTVLTPVGETDSVSNGVDKNSEAVSADDVVSSAVESGTTTGQELSCENSDEFIILFDEPTDKAPHVDTDNNDVNSVEISEEGSEKIESGSSTIGESLACDNSDEFIIIFDDDAGGAGENTEASVEMGESGDCLVHLPRDIRLATLMSLKESLIQTLDARSVTMDTNQVKLMDAASLQLICSYSTKLNELDIPLQITGQSKELADSMQLLGLSFPSVSEGETETKAAA